MRRQQPSKKSALTSQVYKGGKDVPWIKQQLIRTSKYSHTTFQVFIKLQLSISTHPSKWASRITPGLPQASPQCPNGRISKPSSMPTSLKCSRRVTPAKTLGESGTPYYKPPKLELRSVWFSALSCKRVLATLGLGQQLIPTEIQLLAWCSVKEALDSLVNMAWARYVHGYPEFRIAQPDG